MKKILLSLVLIASTLSLFAQNQKVQSAILYNRHGELDKARLAIDDAVKHPKTIESPKAWYHRGEVYLAIFGSEEYASLADDPLAVALESYVRSIALDTKNDFSDDSKRKVLSAQATIYNRGVERYMAKDFSKALGDFEMLLVFQPEDTSILFNAALAAEKLEDNKKAAKYFNALLDADYKKPAIYQTLAQMAKAEKDTAKALVYLSEGRKQFPNEVGLVIDELNIYLLQNRQQEVITNLNEALKLDPTNATLYFALGSAYDQMKDKEQAAANYQKAIENKPTYFDAYYNLGAMYFNDAAELVNEANKIPFNQQKKYEEAIKKVKAAFEKAQPYLEKAHEIDPEDANTMASLQQLYAQLKMNDKAMEMKNKREALKK
jgi:tetratricopeptide (TPR) repeat protein